jgi:hypothetical protein
MTADPAAVRKFRRLMVYTGDDPGEDGLGENVCLNGCVRVQKFVIKDFLLKLPVPGFTSGAGCRNKKNGH